MTRHLFLLRHGDAEKQADDDHARKLTAQGRQECESVIRVLKPLPFALDAVFVSDAVRTRETADALVESEVVNQDRLTVDENLYLATAGELLHRINMIDDSAMSALVISHNPGLYEIARILCNPSYINALQHGFPTCGMAYFSFDVDSWSSIMGGDGILQRFSAP